MIIKKRTNWGGGGGETYDICYNWELSWYEEQNYCDYKAKYTHTHTHTSTGKNQRKFN